LYKKLISKGLSIYTMSLQHAKILLDKINGLYKSVEIDGQVSSIERDLMLSYVRQFYEAFLHSDSSVAIPAAPAPKPVVVEAPKIVPPPPAPVVEYIIEKPAPRVVEVAPPVVVPPPAPAMEEVPKPIAPPPPPAPLVVVEIPRSEPAPVAPPPPLPTTVFPEPPKPKAAVKPLIKPANERVNQSELFEEKMSKELSDKLGETPLDDIRKGMGLNERIIFLNDLFDGNQQEFDTAVNTLNSAGDFTVAKNYLAHLASRFDWSSKEKQARPFIRLVRRRYNQ
jgi:hypothetical protein